MCEILSSAPSEHCRQVELCLLTIAHTKLILVTEG